jgi:transposase
MDTFTIHHNSEVRRLIEAANCYLVSLPSYSPDFNPIEMIFAKIKAWLKKLKPKAVDELIAAIGEAIAAVTPDEVRACFAHCGYM